MGLNGVALFPCVADGNPPPSVFWKKEGYSTLMFPNNSYGHLHVSLEGTLQINGAQKDDAGYYVCSALSVVDSTTIRAFLQVRASTTMTTTTVMSNLWQTRSCSGNDSNTHSSMHAGYSGCVCLLLLRSSLLFAVENKHVWNSFFFRHLVWSLAFLLIKSCTSIVTLGYLCRWYATTYYPNWSFESDSTQRQCCYVTLPGFRTSNTTSQVVSRWHHFAER